MIGGDNDSQMIFGDLGGLKLPDVQLTGEENLEKTSPRKLVPTRNRTRARCVTGAHATACPTALGRSIVDFISMHIVAQRLRRARWIRGLDLV